MKNKIPSSWNTLFQDKKLPGKIEIPDEIPLAYKNGTADWIGRKKSDTHPVLYVSSIAGGSEWDDEEFEELTGIRTKCYSFAYCGHTSPMRHKRHIKYLAATYKRDVRVFLDSGAHSIHRMMRSGKTLAKRYQVPKEQRTQFVDFLSDKFLELYAEYIRWSYAKGRKFDFYVTLDSKKDCSLIWKNTKKLQKLGVHPTSVFHGDDSFDWMKRYADDGHRLICIGINSQFIKGRDTRRRYYDTVFKTADKVGLSCHGLAITGDKMLSYPWYSVDSATHIKCASFGKILVVVPERQRVAQVHISENYSSFTSYGNADVLSPAAIKNIRAVVEKNGFDYKRLRKDLTYRIIYNAKVLHEAVKANKRNEMKFTSWEALV